jgi:O-antigen ligase
LASGSGVGAPLARVFLHGLNLLQFAAIYLLVQRSRKLDSAARTFLATVAFLNAFVLVASTLASLGFSLPQAFLAEEAAPLAIEGEVVAGSVRRFSVGVVVGCVSAAAFVLALSLLLDPAERRKGPLFLSAGFAGVGIIVGFSRQGVLSLLAGLGVVVLGSLQWRHIRRLFKAAALTVILLLAVVGLLALLPGGDDYLQAFAGRTLLLAQPDAYSTGTVLGRTSMWLDMVADIRANPFVGRGQDAYRQYGNAWEEGSHNFPLEVLHTAGVWGFVPYLAFHAAIPFVALMLTRRARRQGRPPFLLLGLLGAYVAVTFASLTNLIFWGPIYWLVAALLAAAASLASEAAAPSR